MDTQFDKKNAAMSQALKLPESTQDKLLLTFAAMFIASTVSWGAWATVSIMSFPSDIKVNTTRIQQVEGLKVDLGKVADSMDRMRSEFSQLRIEIERDRRNEHANSAGK